MQLFCRRWSLSRRRRRVSVKASFTRSSTKIFAVKLLRHCIQKNNFSDIDRPETLFSNRNLFSALCVFMSPVNNDSTRIRRNQCPFSLNNSTRIPPAARTCGPDWDLYPSWHPPCPYCPIYGVVGRRDSLLACKFSPSG